MAPGPVAWPCGPPRVGNLPLPPQREPFMNSTVPCSSSSGSPAGCSPPRQADGKPHYEDLLAAARQYPAIAAGITNFLAGRPVGDAELDVGAPVFARSKSDLVDPRGR